MDKTNRYIHTMEYSKQKEWTTDICNNLDESHKHYSE